MHARLRFKLLVTSTGSTRPKSTPATVTGSDTAAVGADSECAYVNSKATGTQMTLRLRVAARVTVLTGGLRALEVRT
jgi:hypothetical protein